MDITSFLIFFIGGTLLTFVVLGIAAATANRKDADNDEISAIERETLIARH